MAGNEPWNRVNIPFPGTVSSVRIHFTPTTNENIRALLVENEKVLKLIRSEILQTEVRVLYELMYNLNNSFRGVKTFRALKQVEQCVNRIKIMKLGEVLGELSDLCPNKIQRGVSSRTGECAVPSQPMLEWLCLKVLGAAQLMSCTLDRCSRAFVLSKKHMKLDEFIILNVVLTSMLSRLWVIFRGILVSLSTLYQQLLVFLREVAHAQPMPYVTDFSLPQDFTQFLGASFECLLSKKIKLISSTEIHKETQQRVKTGKVRNRGPTSKVKEDMGVAIERGIIHDKAMKPYLRVFKNCPEGKSLRRVTSKSEKRQGFKKKLAEVTSFSDMAVRLRDMIVWCKSQRMKKEEHLLTFLQYKCNKMLSLETAGYNVERKLKSCKKEASWALSPVGSAPRTCRFSESLLVLTRKAHWKRQRYQSLRQRFRFSNVRTGIRKKCLKKKQKRNKLLSHGLSKGNKRAVHKATSRTTEVALHDIDDIFSSFGL